MTTANKDRYEKRVSYADANGCKVDFLYRGQREKDDVTFTVWASNNKGLSSYTINRQLAEYLESVFSAMRKGGLNDRP